jgi:threonylcarbamoyladenosine tRNA methylthiotransferase MtaB
MLSVSIYTLGCKLNQLESEALADAFRQAGFSLVVWEDSGKADILVINTCTVTSRSDQKARRIIRKVLRDNPRSSVIVTGCYAVLDREKIESLARAVSRQIPEQFPPEDGNLSRLFVTAAKADLLNLPAHLAAAHKEALKDGTCLTGELIAQWLKGERSKPEQDSAFCFAPEKFSFHTRASLKIQDGCDKHCSYCRIRLARGPSRSMSAQRILEELQALEAAGYWEAVLTGVNITQYRDNTGGLTELLRFLLEGTRTIGIRLSSLEPLGIDEGFAGVLAHPRIRPHFHLSVQSGSGTVLGKMGRTYSGLDVEKAAALLRSAKHRPFLACDIITGFPGEGEAEFEETLSLCRNLDFAWIHAFPYSKRPGTAAFSLPLTVSEAEAQRRVNVLTELAVRGRQSYARSWIGAELETLVVNGAEKKAGYCRGLTDNYLRVLIRHPEAPAGTVLSCVIRELSALAGYDVQAEVS